MRAGVREGRVELVLGQGELILLRDYELGSGAGPLRRINRTKPRADPFNFFLWAIAEKGEKGSKAPEYQAESRKERLPPPECVELMVESSGSAGL